MRGSLVAVVTFSVALLSLSPLQAQDEDKALTQEEKIELFSKLTKEHGSAEDKFQLGGWHFTGWEGVPQDYTKALHWLRLAALDDHLQAQFVVGGMYHQGIGVQQDQVRGALWSRLAAEKGHVESQYYLGRGYASGEGVAIDYPAAVRQYRRAAEQGHAESQYRLGVAYILGQGVPEDPIQAHKWLNLAASHISGERHEEIRDLRNSVASGMSVGQLNTARQLAAEWKPSTWEALQASD